MTCQSLSRVELEASIKKKMAKSHSQTQTNEDFFPAAAFWGVAHSELNGAGGVNMASVLPRLPPVVPLLLPQIMVLHPPDPPSPPWSPETFYSNLSLTQNCICSLDLDVRPAVKIIESHLYLQELPNDAKHHNFPISAPSVCFYQFVTNSVSSICFTF